MSCEQIKDDLVAYVLDDLPLGQVRTVEQHLQTGCPSCNAELIEVKKELDHVFEAIPDERLSDAEIEEIHRQVVAKHNVRINGPSVFTTSLPSSIAYPVAFALGLVLSVAALSFFGSGKDTPSIAKGSLPQNTDPETFPQDNTAVILPESFREFDNVVFTAYEIEPEEPTRPIRSMLLYDAFSEELHYYAESEEGSPRQCVLVITDTRGQEIARQPFDLDESGKVSLVVSGLKSPEFFFRVEYDN